MEWLNLSSKNLFRKFVPYIQKLPKNKTLSQNNLLVQGFRLYSQNGLEIYYAPVGHVQKKARIIPIGVTPGWSQMEQSYRVAKSLIERWRDHGRILLEINRQIAYAGSMRRNLLKMLDELKLPEYLEIEHSEVLFEEKTALVHTTSALRYPVFYQEKNYTGHAPKILSREMHRMMLEKLLFQELQQVPKALIITLGDASSRAVRHLVVCGRVEKGRCLFGFPHPSGANAHRVKEFSDRKADLRKKLRSWFRRNS